MSNPHWSYVISFLFAMLVYQLGWSIGYPPLNASLLIFILATLIVHSALGWLWKKKFSPTPIASIKISPTTITIFLYVLWIIEFIYEGGIPLLKVILGQPYNYRLFGVPSLHVFAVTFSSFFTIFLFHLYLTTKQKGVLILFIINWAAALLITSRAMFIFIMIAAFFVYLGFGTVNMKYIRWIPLIGVIILFLFGVAGNVRESFEAKSRYNPFLFLDTGSATAQFRNSWIPKEFFWGYIYISSPLANLQTNINTYKSQNKSYVFFQHVNNEMAFDFISKRVNRLLGWERELENPIQGPFNVSTVYSRSYSYQGWTGIFLMAFFVATFPWIYRWLLPQNAFALTGIAILNTMFLFLVYDNTIRFTGLSLQLVYPIIFPAFERAWLWTQERINQ